MGGWVLDRGVTPGADASRTLSLCCKPAHTAHTLFSSDTVRRERTTGFLCETPRGSINLTDRLWAGAGPVHRSFRHRGGGEFFSS